MMCLLIPIVMPHMSASWRIRQYRYLQSRLLQCMDHSIQPYGLLMLRDVTPAHKRLALSGFSFLRTIFTIQGAPRGLAKYGVTESLFQLLFFNLALVSA